MSQFYPILISKLHKRAALGRSYPSLEFATEEGVKSFKGSSFDVHSILELRDDGSIMTHAAVRRTGYWLITTCSGHEVRYWDGELVRYARTGTPTGHPYNSYRWGKFLCE